jgi:uncharacterized protein (DUF433 family)
VGLGPPLWAPRARYTRRMPAVAYPHIVTDAQGVLRVEGAHYKVIVLLESILARGLGIDEMLESWPQLTRAQAHALMAYYHDNKAALDEVMREREERANVAYAETYDEGYQEQLIARLRTRMARGA